MGHTPYRPRNRSSLAPFCSCRGDGKSGFVKIGDVLLAVTGAEATYADMGHFGKWPVRVGWLAVCYPCLVFQYLGACACMKSYEILALALGKKNLFGRYGSIGVPQRVDLKSTIRHAQGTHA